MPSSERTALVTGATRNIGRAIATRLAQSGMTVVVNGRDKEAVSELVSEIGGSGGQAMALVADVTDQHAVSMGIRSILQTRRSIDILVNNAVDRAYGNVTDLSARDWHKALSVVLDGAFYSLKAVVPSMQEHRWGRIVNIAGLGGQRGSAGHIATGASKGGLIGMTRALADELGAWGITVNAVSPGFIATERRPVAGDAAGAVEHYRKAHERAETEVPARRAGEVTEVAELCAFLVSDNAAYINGQVIGINGGAF